MKVFELRHFMTVSTTHCFRSLRRFSHFLPYNCFTSKNPFEVKEEKMVREENDSLGAPTNI